MWHSFKINDSQYFVSIEIKNSQHYCVLLTDLVNVWKETLDRGDVINRFKMCNPKVESSEEKVIEFVEDMFKFEEGSDIGLQVLEQGLMFNINKTLMIKISFHFMLSKQKEEAIYKEITLPLLLVINELRHSQNELYKQLEAKDLHIREFELERCKITRKNVITSKFSKDEFETGLKSNLEERIKVGLESASTIFTKEINEIYPALQKIEPPLHKETLNPDNIIKEANSTNNEGFMNNKPKISAVKRCGEGNTEALVCKRIKATKKIIM